MIVKVVNRKRLKRTHTYTCSSPEDNKLHLGQPSSQRHSDVHAVLLVCLSECGVMFRLPDASLLGRYFVCLKQSLASEVRTVLANSK